MFQQEQLFFTADSLPAPRSHLNRTFQRSVCHPVAEKIFGLRRTPVSVSPAKQCVLWNQQAMTAGIARTNEFTQECHAIESDFANKSASGLFCNI